MSGGAQVVKIDRVYLLARTPDAHMEQPTAVDAKTLKAALEERGLETEGQKAVLVGRLLEALQKLFAQDFLSNLAKRFVRIEEKLNWGIIWGPY